ncbi:MAG: hypothetical protein AB1730_07805 [Myxococcota bacterium]
MSPLLVLVLVAGAWDDFDPPKDVPRRPASSSEALEAFDDVEKAIAAWQAERKEFRQAQHELAVTRDVRDLRALPWPDTRDVEVVRNPKARPGRGKVVEPKGRALSPAEEKLQAELDAAEARAEDYRRRCAEDPVGCAKASADKRRLEAGNQAFDEAAGRRQAELERREQDIARRQQELEAQQKALDEQQKAMAEEAEKMKKALDARKKATEAQARQNDAALRGIVDALGD